MIQKGFIILYRQNDLDGYCPIVASSPDEAREAFLQTLSHDSDETDIKQILSFEQLRAFKESILKLAEDENLTLLT